MFSGVIATRVETKQSSAANKRGQRNGCVQAIYDYVPQYEAELALHVGDIIEVFLLSPRRRFSDASNDFELFCLISNRYLFNKDVVENEDGWWSGDLVRAS